MKKNSIPPFKYSHNDKSSLSILIKVTTTLALSSELFFTNPTFSQENKHTISSQNSSTTIMIENKHTNISNILILNDSLEHEKIIHMHPDDVLLEYGPEKGLELLQYHMLIEINKLRKEFNDSVLIPNKENWTLKDLTLNQKLCKSAQAYAQYMWENNRFEHRGKDGSTFESRIKATGYPFKFLGEILSKRSSIYDVVQGRKQSQAHHNVINNRKYLHAGFGYYQGYRVGHFGGPE